MPALLGISLVFAAVCGIWGIPAGKRQPIGAAAARRLLFIRRPAPDRLVEMRGFANQRLLNPADPNDPRNRRISLVVKFGQDGQDR